ncbi:AhpC/TSA family protein [Paenibacillus sp. IB182496]|uniref:thioredoxin-dependent peroxiredoxin n=1 Tax=Paenibacillus sabuli TaxID=2772509 RepID=A0A927BTT6_9BACL|nr:peroxiredoxin-like family protein [Paenibacillus sabuli]MBD2846671.1 AhpC/TSA family protein [Paenibacillus sabuli]
MSLQSALHQTKQAFLANTPADVHRELFRSIREQEQSGVSFGLEEGAKAKDFTLHDALGAPVNLNEQLAQGPVVLTFYRGGWCPFCSTQLRAYQKALPEIEALGAKLIAVSPQSPDNTLSQQEKEGLRFRVLSDTHGLVAAKYNLLYEVPDYIQSIMSQQFGMSLAEYNATTRWILPVPATFMIDETGIVRSRYVNPDFMSRPDPLEILSELRKL